MNGGNEEQCGQMQTSDKYAKNRQLLEAAQQGNEKEAGEAMEELMKSHTIIFVAHRLSTIRNVNRILVFRHGEIIEEGTYDELAAGDGEFRRLLDAAEGALETGVRSHFAI